MPIKLLSRMKIGHSMNLAAIHEPHAYEVYVVQRELEKIQDQLQQTNTGDIMLNSTPNRSDNSSSSQQPLIVNTSSFNKEDLHNYINVSEEIDRRQLLRRLSHPTPLQATMTREEIFECSTLEDDNFLTALEFQNSYRPRQITDLDLSQSMENVLSYFDEDVNVDSCRSNCDTPTRLPPAGTVAAAIAHFQTDLSPPPPYYEDHATAQPPQYVNIQELRKKYEPIGANGVEKPNQTLRATQSLPPRPPQLKPRKYSPVLVHPLPPKSPKLSRKSRVMQMAQMFNAKISQLMRRDVKEKSYAPLQNEFSPDHLKPMHKIAAVKPLPKPRVKKPVYRTGCVLPSPKPSPRFRRKQVVPQPPAHEHELVQSARQQPYNSSDKACLVAEDVFRQLSVKDKALLYNKFIEDMSRQHPQFSVHARVVEATVQQELARGEAAAERQRVKEIARQLEAKFNLPKPKISAWALKRLAHLQKSSEFVGDKRRSPTPPPVIAAALQRAEEETDANAVDEDEEEELHVSTLTVVLKPSPEKQTTPKQRSVFRQLPRKQREQRFINDMRNIEVARKRNNETMRTSFSFDVYGPPKKIRRTRAERMHPREIFQNTHMERLFYSWLMEKNGVTFDITTVENSDASLSPVLDRQEREDAKGIENDKTSLQTLLDKAEAKLNKELVKKETFTKEEDEAIQQLITAMDAAKISDCDEKVTSKPTKRSAPLAPEQQSNIASSASSCGKLSDAESEAGLSSLPKVTSDESQPDHAAPQNISSKTQQKPAEAAFVKPIKPPRKKKFRRVLTWRKEHSIIESGTLPITTTTSESESDQKMKETGDGTQMQSSPKPQKPRRGATPGKKYQNSPSKQQQSTTENDCSLQMITTALNNLNLSQNIRSSYTLTAMSSPSPCTESDPPPQTVGDVQLLPLPRHRNSISCPSVVTALSEQLQPERPAHWQPEPLPRTHHSTVSSTNIDASQQGLGRTSVEPPRTPQPDSFVDQGFETGSNGGVSPARLSQSQSPKATLRHNKTASPLFIKLTPEIDKTNSRRLSMNSANVTYTNQERSSFTSTPVKGTAQSPQNFNSQTRGEAHQAISPIPSALKSRRRSLQADESRRSSSAMQVIREDLPVDQFDRGQTPFSPTNTDHSFFANCSTLDMTPSIPNMLAKTEYEGKTSTFWIKANEFTICMEVFYNPPDRLRLLYDIFSQKSCDTRDLHFGIDDHKFTVHNPIDKEDIYSRLPVIKGCSHYWFSTGDLAVPFSGKFMPSDKIKRLFNFLNDSLTDKTQLSFGVDSVEFSGVPENWANSPKFSLESSYSMLLGLQGGSTNGLEGRDRNAWPYVTKSPTIKTSDLDNSEFGSEEYETGDLHQLSESPFGSNYFDMASLNSEELLQRNSNVMASPEVFSGGFDKELLDKLFECPKEGAQQLNNSSANKQQSLSITQMLETLESQKYKLKMLEQRLRSYAAQKSTATGAGKVPSVDSPEYMRKMRTIISAIDNIGRENGFKACNLRQLEGFMYYLTRYAETCLANCGDHLNKPPENELQKSHDHNPAALSEHQLRVQASLQRLNIPDWFRQYNQNTSRSPDGSAGGSAYKPGNFTRKRTTESGRWAGLNSKTTSLSSLGSQRSDRSPLLLSPSAHSHHGGQSTLAAHQHASGTGAAGGTHGGGAGAFSRWSTSHLNSSQTSPSVSQRGSFTRGGPINSSFMSVASGQSNVIRSSFRQPYLGWRSQEKLSQRTPHERLASSLLAQQQRTSPTQRTPNATNGNNGGKLQPVTPEIQSSIKEVTSAIVHYVNDQTNQQRSRSTSPNSRKCWLESSFVGIRPLDSPQTPIIESNTTNTFGSANNSCSSSNQYNNYNYAYNYNYNNTSNSSVGTTSSFHSTAAAASATAPQAGGVGITTAITTNPHVLRMNGLSIVGGAPERSLSSASLEDVLASLLGLPSSSAGGVGVGASTGAGPSSSTSDPYARSTTGDSASQGLSTFRHMPQQQQQLPPPQQQPHLPTTKLSQLQVNQLAEQQRLRRRSEGDAPTQQKQQQQQQQLQLLNQNAKSNSTPGNTNASAANSGDVNINTATSSGPGTGTGTGPCIGAGNATIPPRRVSVGDSSESNNKTTSELQIKCRNTKCDRSATPADAKKYYKSCHNCTHLYCSRECRRAHWEKHRKACLHSRASNLCRQVLATCKDDVDSQRHLSLLARKGFLSQGRGVVRVLFRSAEAAESFIKHGFQCMGEASYVRWPDLMPAEMGLELYSELLKLSTEYKPDSKMLIYVAICVVSEAPGMGQAPVRWERQLVSRCAKLKLCKSILAELEQQHQSSSTQLQQCAILQQQSQLAIVNVPEPTTEILILTFNPTLRTNAGQGELILTNILDILSRRGVLLRKHYPEIYQRLQTFTDGQTDKFNPVTLHPRDSQTGKSFVCIIMPVHSTEREVIKLPSASDGGNRVTTIDVGSPAALAQLDDDELLTRSAS